MRYRQMLKVSGVILLAGLAVLVTVSVTANLRRSKAAAAPGSRPVLTRTIGPLAKAVKPVGTGKGGGSVVTGVAIDSVGGRALRIHAVAELGDSGADQRYMWSIGVYAADDYETSNPLFLVHDKEHPFAVPPGGNLNPTFDQLLEVPLPPGPYRVEVGLLSFPPRVHLKGLAKVTNTSSFRGARTSKVVLLTD